VYARQIFEGIGRKAFHCWIVAALFTLILPINLLALAPKKEANKHPDKLAAHPELLKLLKESEYYYVLEDHDKADSIFRKARQLAEFTRDQDVILQTLFYNSSLNISENTTLIKKDNFLDYVQAGLEYAKVYNRQDYIAYGNINLSEIYRKKGDLQNAQKFASLAFSTALNLENDSCKVLAGLQLGKVYQEQREMLLAFKAYTNANDIASKKSNPNLLSMVFHALGGLYYVIGKEQEAKEYYFKSLELNNKSGNTLRIIEDYIAIGASYDYDIASEYLDRALAMADSIGDKKLEKKALIYIFNHLIVQGDCSKAFDYLEQHPVVKTYYENRGPFSYFWTKGEIFLYGNQMDSARKYFDQAAIHYLDNSGYDKNGRLNFISEYAMVYDALLDKQKAYELYQTAFNLSIETKNYREIINNALKLKGIYFEREQYKEAYQYSIIHERYKDTLNQLLKEREFASLEIENENKRIEAESIETEIATKRKHNIQYMGITVLTCLIFTFLLFISGKSRYSLRFVEIIGFFAFIFLFEFIILVLDHKIHHLTHGSPFLIWLIKIVIISFLLPLHHFTEGRVVHYLTTKKLIIPSEKIQLKRFWDIFSLNHGHPGAEKHEKEKEPHSEAP
jgi:predicted negative regulator of RcsB-dependent stress response